MFRISNFLCFKKGCKKCKTKKVSFFLFYCFCYRLLQVNDNSNLKKTRGQDWQGELVFGQISKLRTQHALNGRERVINPKLGAIKLLVKLCDLLQSLSAINFSILSTFSKFCKYKSERIHSHNLLNTRPYFLHFRG